MSNINFRIWAKIGFSLGLIAIVLGAFGAHYIGDQISLKSLNAYQTGIKYQFYHALLMIILAFNHEKFDSSKLRIAMYLLLTGIVFFSFSIYFLTTKSITGLSSTAILGPMTPIGGVILMGAWLMAIISIKK